MGKLTVCNVISLDGSHSGPCGDVMAMPFDAGFSDYNAERLRAADTLLLGRTSYEGFRSYWPKVAEDMTQPAVEREISRLNAAIEEVQRRTPRSIPLVLVRPVSTMGGRKGDSVQKEGVR